MRNALFLAAALLAAPAAVLAEGISYTYADARYFSTDSDAARNVNFSGATVAGSFALGPMFFAAADGQYAQSEKVTVGTSSGRLDFLAASARLGAHFALAPTLDLVATAGALYNRLDGSGALSGRQDDDFGYIGDLGLRLALVPQVEVGAFYSYQDISDDTKSAFTADVQWHLAEQISIVGSATSGRNTDIYSIGARYRF